LEWHVAIGNAHHAIGLAGARIGAVDAIGWNVTVPIKKAVVANAAATVLNGVLLAVDLHAADGAPVSGGQLKVAAGERTVAGDLPSAEDIAAAMNRLDTDTAGNNYKLFSQAATGSIAGITRVLADYWTNETVSFPSPSMYGSGDRVSICWAVFGRYPDITEGIEQRDPNNLYHACQALDLEDVNAGDASVAVFHSCRGSNECKAEGGCGFVQKVGETKILCGMKVMKEHLAAPAPQATKILYSAPSDNVCAGFGGCAIPISASQLYPLLDSSKPDQKTGTMELCDFTGEHHVPERLPNNITFSMGDKVYDIAWNAYIEVLKHRNDGKPLPVKPETPSDLRLAFPPST